MEKCLRGTTQTKGEEKLATVVVPGFPPYPIFIIRADAGKNKREGVSSSVIIIYKRRENFICMVEANGYSVVGIRYRRFEVPAVLRLDMGSNEWLDSILVSNAAEVKSLLASKLGRTLSMDDLMRSNDGLGLSMDNGLVRDIGRDAFAVSTVDSGREGTSAEYLPLI